MRAIKSVEVDYDTTVFFRGMHRDVAWEVCQRCFKKEEDIGSFDFAVACATYVILTPELHEKFKSRINDAPWNCGQTYYRKITEDHINAPADLAEKWRRPYYKIGDDFMHLYDHERQDLFYRGYLEKHIKNVIDFLIDGSVEELI